MKRRSADPEETGLGLREKPFVPVGLMLRVERGDQSAAATLRVQSFRHSGRTYFAGTDLYESNSMVGLARGDYVLRVRTESDAALFRASGVILGSPGLEIRPCSRSREACFRALGFSYS
jgi:hypothetical protein